MTSSTDPLRRHRHSRHGTGVWRYPGISPRRVVATLLGGVWHSRLAGNSFGWSFDFQEPVSNLINERIALTLVISLCILIFTCAAFIPVGIIVSAVKQYSLTDYTVTLHDFLGGWRRAISYARCC